jgi:hypothetical protein
MKRAVPAGRKWRILAHNLRKPEPIRLSSDDHPGYVFDELVIDRWLHLEQMDTRQWWLAIGDDMVVITVDGDGKPHMGEWYR